jgi:hypothetical protein
MWRTDSPRFHCTLGVRCFFASRDGKGRKLSVRALHFCPTEDCTHGLCSDKCLAKHRIECKKTPLADDSCLTEHAHSKLGDHKNYNLDKTDSQLAYGLSKGLRFLLTTAAAAGGLHSITEFSQLPLVNKAHLKLANEALKCTECVRACAIIVCAPSPHANTG